MSGAFHQYNNNPREVEEFRISKVLYGDDATLVSESLKGVERSVTDHKRVAKIKEQMTLLKLWM